jgi:hypothetical protein
MTFIIINITYKNHHQVYKSVFHTVYLDIFMPFHHTKLQMSGSNNFFYRHETKKLNIDVFVISHSTEKIVSVRVPHISKFNYHAPS